MARISSKAPLVPAMGKHLCAWGWGGGVMPGQNVNSGSFGNVAQGDELLDKNMSSASGE